MLPEGHWRIVGAYHPRTLRQDNTRHGEWNPSKQPVNPNDVPILLYDTAQKDMSSLAPRYVAMRVQVPEVSSSKTKILSGSAQMPALNSTPLNSSLNRGTEISASHLSSNTKKSSLIVATTFPQPLNTVLLPFFIILLADIAITAVGVTTVPTSHALTVLICLLVFVPDVLGILLVLRHEQLSLFLAIHIELWAGIAFLSILPFISEVFLLHFFVSVIFLFFLFRIRVSSHMTFFVFP